MVKFLSSDPPHPLSGHLRAALEREGDLCGLVPLSVMAVYDSRLNNLCKCINPKVESNPFLVIPLIMRAASRLSELVATSEGQLSIWRKKLYPPEVIESSVDQKSGAPQSTLVEAIHIPCSQEKAIELVILDISSTGYYLDVIAKKLDLADAAKVLISR